MLEQLFNKYGCDKAKKHHYHTVYDKEFESIREQPINFLEIGVFKGDSVRAWIDYFPNATIYGIDIFKRVAAEDIDILQHERVKWLKADSTDISVREQIKKEWPGVEFDIILDDGLHTPIANKNTLHNLWPFLKQDGRFYIEDVWPIDIMTITEMKHRWIEKHPHLYNMLKMNQFLAELDGKQVKRFDCRKLSGEGDSYIIRVQ